MPCAKFYQTIFEIASSILIFISAGCPSNYNGLQLNVRVEDGKTGNIIPKAQVIVELNDGSNYKNTQTDNNGYASLFFDESYLNKQIKIIVRKEGFSDFVKNNVLVKDFPTVITLKQNENNIFEKTNSTQSNLKPILNKPNSSPLEQNTREENSEKTTLIQSDFPTIGSSKIYSLSKGRIVNYKFNGETNEQVAFVISKLTESYAYYKVSITDSFDQNMDDNLTMKFNLQGGNLIFTPPKTGGYKIKIKCTDNSGKYKISREDPEKIIK